MTLAESNKWSAVCEKRQAWHLKGPHGKACGPPSVALRRDSEQKLLKGPHGERAVMPSMSSREEDSVHNPELEH